jgi:hypothetical protein
MTISHVSPATRSRRALLALLVAAASVATLAPVASAQPVKVTPTIVPSMGRSPMRPRGQA